MAKETERRFLVKPGFDPAAASYATINLRQSYVRGTGSTIMRLRRAEREGVISHVLEIKKPVTAMTNDEHSIPIDADLYASMRLMAGDEIVKTRHLVEHGGRIWEIDIYLKGDPAIPMIAEVELPSEDAKVDIPDWAAREVTGNRRYSNAMIARRMANAR